MEQGCLHCGNPGRGPNPACKPSISNLSLLHAEIPYPCRNVVHRPVICDQGRRGVWAAGAGIGDPGMEARGPEVAGLPTVVTL
jgi:hypothetical protein